MWQISWGSVDQHFYLHTFTCWSTTDWNRLNREIISRRPLTKMGRPSQLSDICHLFVVSSFCSRLEKQRMQIIEVNLTARNSYEWDIPYKHPETEVFMVFNGKTIYKWGTCPLPWTLRPPCPWTPRCVQRAVGLNQWPRPRCPGWKGDQSEITWLGREKPACKSCANQYSI